MHQPHAWAPRPSSDQLAGIFHPLMRVKGQRPLTALCLANDLLGRDVHYFGRTLPCTQQPDCPGCVNGRPTRWTAWFPALIPTSTMLCIVEVTKSVLPTVDRWLQVHGTLRGAVLTLSRMGQRDNGRMLCTIAKTSLPEPQIPAGFDVATALENMWQQRNTERDQEPTPASPVNRLANGQAKPATNGKH